MRLGSCWSSWQTPPPTVPHWVWSFGMLVVDRIFLEIVRPIVGGQGSSLDVDIVLGGIGSTVTATGRRRRRRRRRRQRVHCHGIELFASILVCGFNRLQQPTKPLCFPLTFPLTFSSLNRVSRILRRAIPSKRREEDDDSLPLPHVF